MDFWRAYRVLAARRWLILGVVLVTTVLVGAVVLTYAQKWDGQTAFGPTPEAVRTALNAGNDEKNTPMQTPDSRVDEVKRIAGEVKAPDNVQNALLYLARAPGVQSTLEQSLGSPIYVLTEAPDFASIEQKIKTATAKLSAEQTGADTLKDLNNAIPSNVWADFIYLASWLKYSNAPADLLTTRFQDTVDDVIDNADVPDFNSRYLVLSVRNTKPRLAEIFATALTAAYKARYDNINKDGAQKTVNVYTAEEQAAQKRLIQTQAQLAMFRRTHKDVFLPDQVALAIRGSDSARQEVETLNSSIGDFDAQIKAKKARLVSLPKMLKHPVQTDSAEIASLRSKVSDLNAQIAEKTPFWTDKNPEMARMRDQLKSLQARLTKVEGAPLVTSTTYTENEEYLSLEREIARLEQTRKGLVARLATQNGVLAKKTAIVAQLPETATLSQILASNAANAAEKYQDATKKLSAAQSVLTQTESDGSLTVRVWAGLTNSTQHPETPARQGATKRTWTMIIAAFLLSLLGSVGVVLGLDFLDTSLKSSMDVERMLDIPVNGVVPRLEGPNRGMLSQVTHKLPSSPQAESYRFLGTDILLSASGDQPYKTIMVATAKPGQGGTSTICNLAITLAQAGQTVVLVDADLRRPSLHNVFNVPNDLGLTTVLSNGKLPSDVLQRTEIENLYVMPGGPKAENAWKLLRSAKMKEVIADLQRDFDFVLFDTPSAVVFADAATLATMVDGVLLVVRAHEAPSGSEMQVKNLLNKTKARIVGVVLNDMPLQQVDSARYFSHYYGTSGRAEIGAASTVTAKPALPKRGSDEEI